MKHKLKARLRSIVAWVKAHKAISVIGALLLLGGLILLVLNLTNSDNAEVNRTDPMTEVEEQDEPEPPKTVASPLTGVQVSEEQAARPVTAIVIENSPDARPQSSLDEAGFIFESIAEGGITRFLAFYQENRPDPIGPVRSLRPYFSDWVLAFDASIAHVGGSAEALGEVGALGLKDLDQFSYGNSYYRTTDRFAPHNVYTDFDKLDALNKSLGFNDSDFDSFPRKAPKPLGTPKASTVTINVSSITYQASYVYDDATNTYLRRTAGKPVKDRESGNRLAPSVVIVPEIAFSIGADGRYDYELVGSGKVTVFQDGNVEVGTWKRSSRSSQMTFVDDDGDEIKLNPGQVWMTAISPSQEVEFTP